MTTTNERLSTYTSATTVFTTELNSLANNGKVLSSAIDNSTNGYTLADFELVCTFGTSPTANTTIDVSILPAADGTNYPDGDSSTDAPPNLRVASFPLRNVNTAQRIVFCRVSLPAGLFKIHLKNLGGQTLASSGNTLKYAAYGFQLT